MTSILASPLPAALIGLALGAALLVVSRVTSRLVTPEDPGRGFAVVALVMLVRMFVVVGALALYAAVARGGLVAFGASLVAAFLLSLAVEAVRMSRSVTLSGSSG